MTALRFRSGDASFAQHAREQRERWLALTPEERLRWLEGAKRFERAVRAAQRTTGDVPVTSAAPEDRSRR